MIWILLTLGLCAALVLFIRRNYGTLEKLGIPVVPPSLMLGELLV